MSEDKPALFDLPRDGYALYYRDSDHAYRKVNPKGLPGIRWPGASTVAKAFPDSPDGLMYWVEKMSLEGVAKLSEARRTVPTNPQALRSTLEKHGLRWPQLRDSAAERGTNVHERMVEALARNEGTPDLDVLSEDEQGYGQAMMKWWLDRKPDVTHFEQCVLSLEHGFAGRFDLRCTLGNPRDARYQGIGIVDAKTSKRPYRSDHIQLRLYDIAAKECGIGEQEWLMVLQLCPDGTYVEHFCAATEAQALQTLDIYNEAKQLEREMKAA